HNQNVHKTIIEFVESSPGVFDDPESNPRAWKYASDILQTWELSDRCPNLLSTSLAGVLGDKWALAFMQFYTQEQKPLSASDIFSHYPAHRAIMKNWTSNAKLDLVVASLEGLKRVLQRQQFYTTIVNDEKKKTHVETFFSDLPADMKRQLEDWLEDRGFEDLEVPKGKM
ncbi:MAG: hypothetical protein ABIG67_02785, partial [Pseudomonadota bacterium]